MGRHAIPKYDIKLNDEVVFRDEWKEKELFGYGVYRVTYLSNSGRRCTVQEVTSGLIYEGNNTTQLRPLNLN